MSSAGCQIYLSTPLIIPLFLLALVELYDSDASEPTRPLIFSGGNSDKPYIKPIDKLLVEQPSTQPTAKRQMTFQGRSKNVIRTCSLNKPHYREETDGNMMNIWFAIFIFIMAVAVREPS